MTHTERIIGKIKEVFGETEPNVARACDSIIDYVMCHKHPERLHLTFSLLKRETPATSDKDLMLAIQFLSGATARFLEMKFEFMDDDGEYYPLSANDIAQARKHHALGHPITGELMRDYDDRVLVYFEPNLSSETEQSWKR